MLLKKITALKTDTSDRLFSNFRRTNGLKNLKSDLLFLSKKLTAKAVKRLVFRLNASSGQGRNRRNLDFNRKNNRNVFARTKRKSAFGQTLQEKQKLQAYTGLDRSFLKKIYAAYGTKSLSKVESLPAQVLKRTGLFDAQPLKQKIFFGKGVLQHPATTQRYTDFGISLQDRMRIPKLETRPRLRFYKRKRPLVFDRPLTNNLLLDLRINKIKSLEVPHYYYPFRLNPIKLLQHFRLKRS